MVALTKRKLIALSACGLLALGACEKKEAQQPSPPPSAAPAEKAVATAGSPTEAVAELTPTEGNETAGTVVFTLQEGGVLVVADIRGLSAGGHGFHIHETGDCSAMDASSAGGHFNPGDTPHGSPENPTPQRHVGDLGNLEAGEDGSAQYERIDPVISLSGPESIIGKAIIVHAQADDLTSQPTGNAGPRLACGVIQARE